MNYNGVGSVMAAAPQRINVTASSSAVKLFRHRPAPHI